MTSDDAGFGETISGAAAGTDAAGVGRAQHGHGSRRHPRWPAHRGAPPRFDALGRWFLERTADVSRAAGNAAAIEPEATVFTNIVPGSADVVRPMGGCLAQRRARGVREAETRR